MALRELIDKQGVAWKVWDVTPEGMNPATVQELFLGEYQEGWLAFECSHARRRLARWPRDWAQMSDGELEQLCEQATPVVRRAPGSAGEASRRASGEQGAASEGRDASAALTVTFAGSDGKHWMVTPMKNADSTPVLRFTSTDGEMLDLDEWPDDWMRFTAAQLADMARRARPSRPAADARGRREDRPAK